MDPIEKGKQYLGLLLGMRVFAFVVAAVSIIVRSAFSPSGEGTALPFSLMTLGLQSVFAIGTVVGLWGVRRLPGVAPFALSAVVLTVSGTLVLLAGHTVGVVLSISLYVVFVGVLLSFGAAGATLGVTARIATATKSRLSSTLLRVSVLTLGLSAVATITSWTMLFLINHSVEPWMRLVQSAAGNFSSAFNVLYSILLIAAMAQVYLTWGRLAEHASGVPRRRG